MKSKKIISAVLVCVLAFAMSATSFAAGKGNGAGCGNSNAAAIAKIEHQVDLANAQIDKLVAHAQATPKDDVDWLLWKVDQIAANVRAKADKCGVQIACEYVAYEIDGRVVLIDPLMVVHL